VVSYLRLSEDLGVQEGWIYILAFQEGFGGT
jgi:hypothetical protein